MKPKILRTLGFMAVSSLPAFSGIIARPDSWYRRLKKPEHTPPDWIFAPVWSVLYLLIGGAYSFYREKKRTTGIEDPVGEALYHSQLALNASWPLLFFRMKSPLLALVNIISLLSLISFTMRRFSKISKTASLMLLPYLAWVGFATYLNSEIYRLNKE